MYEIVEDHGAPVEHEGAVRASLSKRILVLGSFPAARRMVVLFRTPETCGHGSSARITSEKMAVLLVPSATPTIGTPFRIWPGGAEVEAKMPAIAFQVVVFGV